MSDNWCQKLDWFELLDWWILKMDPLWQFIKDGLEHWRGEFITAPGQIATIIDAIHEKMDANQEERDAKVDTIINAIQERMEA
jgi:hypothetical protein